MNFESVPHFVEDQKMRDAYYDLEHQLVELSRIIPFDNPDNTYSPRLYQILQSACGQIENIMRLFCQYAKLKPTGNNFPAYFEQVNQDKILFYQQVDVKKIKDPIPPFKINKKDHPPFWWTQYNSTKHKLPDGFKSGNLKNTIYAMAGLYSLHCLIYYWNHYGKEILEKSNWNFRTGASVDMYSNIRRKENDHRPRSELFYCINYFEKGLDF